jgi:hypothetical protein
MTACNLVSSTSSSQYTSVAESKQANQTGALRTGDPSEPRNFDEYYLSMSSGYFAHALAASSSLASVSASNPPPVAASVSAAATPCFPSQRGWPQPLMSPLQVIEHFQSLRDSSSTSLNALQSTNSIMPIPTPSVAVIAGTSSAPSSSSDASLNGS